MQPALSVTEVESEEEEEVCVGGWRRGAFVCISMCMTLCLIRLVENIVYNYGIADVFAIPIMILSCSHE